MKSPEEVNTPYQFILWAEKCFDESDLFYGHGTDNAYDEAVYLILRGLGLSFELDDTELNQSLSKEAKDYLDALVRQRIEQCLPVAYILNEAWFCGLSFYVDERVLVPRSPIAELIGEKFSPWVNANEVKHILDVGTGSACIAIAMALAFEDATVDAVDISTDALAVADENSRRHGVSDRLRLIRSDLYENLDKQRYDIIIANPPYVDAEDMQNLPEEYQHEPRIGLEAGEDGLRLVRELLSQSRNHLNDEGILIVEVGNSQHALIEEFPQLPFMWLDFEHGGDGVFLLTAEQLEAL
ncbi:MAG: 50S ribosomal protein L3 N(5)-glutamine methyltransferase [Gammaproteobacteria bacterium]|nr:50S ribosomal protein L3 N(5)-glutamine methyltransferase [Gammaproteobacteria bacterium]